MFQGQEKNIITKPCTLYNAQRTKTQDDHLFYLQMFMAESVDVYTVFSIRKKNQTSAVQTDGFHHIWIDL